jgi:hypothetical protein
MKHEDIDHTGLTGVPSGPVTSSGLTMATARLLGRTTASTGAVEEISVGSGLSLSSGSLSATGAATAVGLNGIALPWGVDAQQPYSGGSSNFGADSVIVQQIIVPAPMVLGECRVRNGDTTGARSWEWRLYVDNGDATFDEVAGANGSESFTAAAASDRTAATSSPVSIAPGAYWLAIRNTHGSNTFNMVYATNGTPLGLITNFSQTSFGGALGSTLDITAFSTLQRIYAMCLLGRVAGQSTTLMG